MVWSGGVIMTLALPPFHRSRSTLSPSPNDASWVRASGRAPILPHAEASYHQPTLFWYGNAAAIWNHMAVFVSFLPLKL